MEPLSPGLSGTVPLRDLAQKQLRSHTPRPIAVRYMLCPVVLTAFAYVGRFFCAGYSFPVRAPSSTSAKRRVTVGPLALRRRLFCPLAPRSVWFHPTKSCGNACGGDTCAAASMLQTPSIARGKGLRTWSRLLPQSWQISVDGPRLPSSEATVITVNAVKIFLHVQCSLCCMPDKVEHLALWHTMLTTDRENRPLFLDNIHYQANMHLLFSNRLPNISYSALLIQLSLPAGLSLPKTLPPFQITTCGSNSLGGGPTKISFP